MIIDHLGLVVQSIEKGVELWEQVFGYKRMTETVANIRQKVNVIFLQKAGSITIKLIEPANTTSPVYQFAMRGGGLHHICFKCDNLEEKVEELKNSGLRILAEPQPGEAFENEKIAFIYAKQGLNIELIDTDKKAKLLPT